MAGESRPNTRTVEVTFLSQCLKADPNLIQDHRFQMEDERRPNVKQNWQRRGPFTDDHPNLIDTSFAGWVTTGTTLVDGGAAPDGTPTATWLQETAITDQHFAESDTLVSLGVPVGERYTMSVFAKPRGRDELNLYYFAPGTTAVYIWMDASDPSPANMRIIDNSAVPCLVEGSEFFRYVGGGWWWIGFTVDHTDPAAILTIYNASVFDTTYTYAGDTTKGTLFWRPQVVLGDTAIAPF